MHEHNPDVDRFWVRTLLVLCLCGAYASSGYGQGATRTASPEPPPSIGSRPSSPSSTTERKNALGATNALGAWIGGSIHTGQLFGNLRNGRLNLIGLRYSRRLLPPSSPSPRSNAPLQLTYTFDLIPASWLFIPKGTRPGALAPNRPSLRKTGLSTFGIGTYPLGLKLYTRPSADLQPFVAGQTGVLYFLDAFPDARGNQFNFGVGFGGGVRVRLASEMALILGYRYHHLSNGFRASINPGLDGNLLYVGANLDL